MIEIAEENVKNVSNNDEATCQICKLWCGTKAILNIHISNVHSISEKVQFQKNNQKEVQDSHETDKDKKKPFNFILSSFLSIHRKEPLLSLITQLYEGTNTWFGLSTENE